VKTKGEAALALTDVAFAGHTILLVAAEQRVITLHLVATALTADAIDDFGNLPNFVEGNARARVRGEILGAEDARGVDPRTWRWMRAGSAPEADEHRDRRCCDEEFASRERRNRHGGARQALLIESTFRFAEEPDGLHSPYKN